jgi:hypothetical protein
MKAAAARAPPRPPGPAGPGLVPVTGTVTASAAACGRSRGRSLSPWGRAGAGSPTDTEFKFATAGPRPRPPAGRARLSLALAPGLTRTPAWPGGGRGRAAAPRFRVATAEGPSAAELAVTVTGGPASRFKFKSLRLPGRFRRVDLASRGLGRRAGPVVLVCIRAAWPGGRAPRQDRRKAAARARLAAGLSVCGCPVVGDRRRCRLGVSGRSPGPVTSESDLHPSHRRVAPSHSGPGLMTPS